MRQQKGKYKNSCTAREEKYVLSYSGRLCDDFAVGLSLLPRESATPTARKSLALVAFSILIKNFGSKKFLREHKLYVLLSQRNWLLEMRKF